MNIAEEINRLQELRDKGALSEEEFVKAKAAILNPPATPAASVPMTPERQAEQERTWAMLLHFALLLKILGAIGAIVIWQVKRKDLPGIEPHGKNAVNWILSELIYAAISGLLCMILIGIPMLMVLGVLGIVFPIMAGIKANNGQVWKYPLSIQFLK
ncbi:MAG: DUF4870 domain-containing protein [Phycisphaerae bacterium]|nr:DUF4870 domain-containing protein [Phycisphaerae bacterium]